MVDNATKVYKLYDQSVLIPLETGSGILNKPFHIQTGSRILFDLYVKELDPGASIKVDFLNNFTPDVDTAAYENVLTIPGAKIGHNKKILTDFQPMFIAKVTIENGSATFAIAVSVFDNAQTTVIENAEIDVHTTSKDTPLREHDSMRIGDQDNELEVNEDGSINVNIVSTNLNETEKNPFNEITNVPSGVESTIIGYTVPPGITTKLQRVSFTGSSIATYNLYVNDEKIDKKNTWFNGPLAGEFNFSGGSEEGQTFVAGDKIELKVTHTRTLSDFAARLQLIEKT